MKSNNTLGICIITFHPDVKKFYPKLRELSTLAQSIVVVDNSKGTPLLDNNSEYPGNVTIISLEKNLGIAKAQNIGIDLFRDNPEIEKVMFLDQDSYFSPRDIQQLLFHYEKIKTLDRNLGAIGPIPINSVTKKPYLNKKLKLKLRHKSFITVRELISSGTLTDKNNFKLHGGFNDNLFIDYVDHEWCWRLKTSGKNCYLISESELLHNLGENLESLFGKAIYVPKPNRNYFQYRNYILLLSVKHVPFIWKVETFIKLTLRIIKVIMVFPEKANHFKFIHKGIKDGFSNSLLSKNKSLSDL